MAVYHAQTRPLVDFYARKGILVSIDGARDIDDVFADIQKAIEQART
jgi:adenylate kinase